MIPADFEAFFATMAAAAAGLIGLLFVAISVAPHRLVEAETRVESQTLAGVALIAFTNVLVVSTVALIPRVDIGWITVPLGAGGVAFAAAQARELIRERHRGYSRVLLVLGLVVVLGWQLVEGIVVFTDTRHDSGSITTIAALLVACLSIGIGRAWRLVGMRDTGLAHSLTTLVRGDQTGL